MALAFEACDSDSDTLRRRLLNSGENELAHLVVAINRAAITHELFPGNGRVGRAQLPPSAVAEGATAEGEAGAALAAAVAMSCNELEQSSAQAEAGGREEEVSDGELATLMAWLTALWRGNVAVWTPVCVSVVAVSLALLLSSESTE